jgi:hypothetical protein
MFDLCFRMACNRWTVAFMLVLSLAWSLRGEAPPPSKGPAVRLPQSAGGQKSDDGGKRLREGTKLIDVTGTFQATGADSVSFLASGNKESYRVLQNLALQRVSYSLEENRALRQWIISGTITKYRGANYLLITKAVIQLPEGEAAAP